MSKLDKFNAYLTTAVFVRRAYSEIEALTHHDYYVRNDPDTRKIVEEVLPLAAFLKHYDRPGRSVQCRFIPGSQNYDAKIKLKGYEVDKGLLEDSYFVEVTSAVSPQDYLVREALDRYGIICGYNIRRNGSKKKGNDRIEGQGAHDFDSPVKDALDWTKIVLRKKYGKKEPYPNPCILVVQVKPARPLSLHEWCTVAEGVQGVIDRDKFRFTYIVDWETNVVFAV